MDRELFVAVLGSKHEAYESEDEARILAFEAPGHAWEREGRYGSQKVLTLTGDAHRDWTAYSTQPAAPLPIAKVMVRPWNDVADAGRVSDLLRGHGYEVPVE